jgi:hypothetical protein
VQKSRSKFVIWLALPVVVLALIAAGVGLLYQDNGSAYTFTTLRGQSVQIYGQGLYRYDTVLGAVGYRAADAVTLVWAVPLLVLSIWLYRRGSLRGGLLLTGTLAYFLYNYGSMAFGAAYNNLFLVYLAIFSACLFAFVLAIRSIDAYGLLAHFPTGLPRRGIGIFLIVSGLVLLVVWMALSIVPALLQGQAPPEVASYTTVITFVVDMGVIAPALVLAGVLLLRRAPLGYLLASVMLIFTVTLGISITVFGIAQLLHRLVTIGQFIGFVAPFTALTLISILYSVVVLRSLSDLRLGQAAHA